MGRPALGRKVTGTRDLQRGASFSERPGLLPESARSPLNAQGRGRSCGEGRASDSGRPPGWKTDSRRAGQLRERGPFSKGGDSLSGRRMSWKYSGAARGPERRPPTSASHRPLRQSASNASQRNARLLIYCLSKIIFFPLKESRASGV